MDDTDRTLEGGRMQTPRLRPLEYSEDTREFLFACAFWTVAADEELKPGEQVWLEQQFGAAKCAELLKACIALEGDRFFEVFDELAHRLGDGDKKRIYPELITWLADCAAADSNDTATEDTVIEQIRKRLAIDTEMRRLQAPAPATAAGQNVTQHASAVHQGTPDMAVRVFRGHTGGVSAVCFSPNGRIVFSGSEDRTVRMWDAAAGVESLAFEEQESGVTAVACSPDGVQLLSGNRSGVLCVWNAGTGALLRQTVLKRRGGITSVCVSPDGKLVLAATELGLLTILEARTGSEVRTFGDRGAVVREAVFGADGKFALSGGDDKLLKTWDVAMGKQVRVFEGHTDGVLAVRFGRNGKQVLSGSRDNSLRLWDAGTGVEVRTLSGHTFSVCGMDISPDGKFVISASLDHTVRLWDLATGGQLRRHEEFGGGFSKAVFSPDGKSAVACNSDRCLYCLDNLASG